MDRFEQLTAYFVAVKEFHDHRDIPICNVMSLMHKMPDLLDHTTSPHIQLRLSRLLANNQHLLPTAATGA